MAAEGEGAGLEATPTYSFAFTAFIFILISLVAERGIHRLKKYLKKTNRRPLRKVLDKMTDELMLLGFISLLLTVLQSSLVKICVSPDFDNHMLPCSKKEYEEEAEEESPPGESHVGDFGRRLLGPITMKHIVKMKLHRQLLAEESLGTGHCGSQGKVPFLTVEGLHQLHIFIFVLAVTHVCYWILTVSLGLWRLHSWSKWEMETRQDGYDGNLDLEKKYCDKLTCQRQDTGLAGHANAFVNRHANHWLYDHEITLWILCFFQQFFSSVSREDYLIFRVGFLNKHNLGESFNFRDYVIRSMEVDFKKVIGIPWWLWLFVVIFLLLDVDGWYSYFWAAFIPTILVVVVGAKQQYIISKLALQAKSHAQQVLADQASSASNVGKSKKVIDIATAITPDDSLFWFDNPKLLLKLIHFIIFQNSFELAVFFWILTTFGWNSCTLGNHALLIVRLVAGVLTQLLTSWTTLPVYALVTQMGSQLKETVFTKDVFEGLQGWRAKAAKRRASRMTSEENSVTSVSGHAGQEKAGALPAEESERRELSSAPDEAAAAAPQAGGEDTALAKKCQALYGKSSGMDILQAAKSCREKAESRRRSDFLRRVIEEGRREAAAAGGGLSEPLSAEKSEKTDGPKD